MSHASITPASQRRPEDFMWQVACALTVVSMIVFMTVLETGKRPLVNYHKCFAFAAVAITVVILYIVEFYVVPHMGRHYTPLFFVHIGCDVTCLIFMGIAFWKNGVTYGALHGRYGWVAVISGVAMDVTGLLMLVKYWHPVSRLLP